MIRAKCWLCGSHGIVDETHFIIDGEVECTWCVNDLDTPTIQKERDYANRKKRRKYGEADES